MSVQVELRFLQALREAEQGVLAGATPEAAVIRAARAHGLDVDELRDLWLRRLVAGWAARQQLEAA